MHSTVSNAEQSNVTTVGYVKDFPYLWTVISSHEVNKQFLLFVVQAADVGECLLNRLPDISACLGFTPRPSWHQRFRFFQSLCLEPC